MRHEDMAGLQDLYFFELPVGTVVLTVDHRRSPMGGQAIRLNLISSNEGTSPIPSAPRPSDFGVAGFDGLWEDASLPGAESASAYGVPDGTVTRLVDALARLEGGGS